MQLDPNPYQSPNVAASTAHEKQWPLSALFLLAVGLPLMAEFGILLALRKWSKFIWLFEQALPVLSIGVLAVAVWLHFAHKSAARANQLQSLGLLWLAPLIVLPFTMLVWGAIFAHSHSEGYPLWQLKAVHYTFYATFGLSAVAVIFNRGRRSFVAAVALMLLIFSFGCAFTASSSVAGDWM